MEEISKMLVKYMCLTGSSADEEAVKEIFNHIKNFLPKEVVLSTGIVPVEFNPPGIQHATLVFSSEWSEKDKEAFFEEYRRIFEKYQIASLKSPFGVHYDTIELVQINRDTGSSVPVIIMTPSRGSIIWKVIAELQGWCVSTLGRGYPGYTGPSKVTGNAVSAMSATLYSELQNGKSFEESSHKLMLPHQSLGSVKVGDGNLPGLSFSNFDTDKFLSIFGGTISELDKWFKEQGGLFVNYETLVVKVDDKEKTVLSYPLPTYGVPCVNSF